MALSQIFYTGDGVTRQYVVNFALGYLDRSEVRVTVDGVDVAFTWMQDNVINFTTAPPLTSEVVFTRTVPKDSLYVDFEDGAIQNAVNLNNIQRHTLMAVHEVMDGRLPAFDVIRADIVALEAGDDLLSAAIAAEALARANADTAEAQARQAGDAQLTAALNTETANRITEDAALGARIDNILGSVSSQVAEAEQYALLSQQYSVQAQDILEDVIATGTGINDGSAYDLGFITDTVTYFNRDMGSITDPVTT